MSKYIDAEMVLPKLYEYHSQGAINAGVRSKNYSVPTFDPMEITDVLEAIPAADVVPVRHGKWLNTHHTSIVQCSLCGGTVATLWKGYFCQNCGAKMDGGSSHE